MRSGSNPRTFEGEEFACPAAADLNLVGNEQDIVPAAKLLQPAQPLRVDDVNSAFGLYRFKQDGGRLVDSGVRISQDILDIAERIHFCESPARVRHERNSAQRKPRPSLMDLELVADRLPSDMPWKPPMNANIPVLFFALRASLRAAFTAFVPVGPQN